jgi:hypothetical protein
MKTTSACFLPSSFQAGTQQTLSDLRLLNKGISRVTASRPAWVSLGRYGQFAGSSWRALRMSLLGRSHLEGEDCHRP